MEENTEKDTQAQPPSTSNPKDSSLPDSSTPPPSYVQPIPIPARPQQPTIYPFPATLPPQAHSRPSTSSLRQQAVDAIGQQQALPENIQKGFHPSLVHRQPTPKPVYADFGGRWGSTNEDKKLKAGSQKGELKGPAERDAPECMD